jgi:hypothetical protein
MSINDAMRFIEENVRDRRDEEEHLPHYHAHNDDDESPVDPAWTVLSPTEKRN